VELRSGKVLVLRNVIMRPTGYCGVQLPGARKYCGEYAEVAAARPGAATSLEEPDLAVPSLIEPTADPTTVE
jgi:hypothetical protein